MPIKLIFLSFPKFLQNDLLQHEHLNEHSACVLGCSKDKILDKCNKLVSKTLQ